MILVSMCMAAWQGDRWVMWLTWMGSLPRRQGTPRPGAEHAVGIAVHKKLPSNRPKNGQRGSSCPSSLFPATAAER